jgi:hypothetical protein
LGEYLNLKKEEFDVQNFKLNFDTQNEASRLKNELQDSKWSLKTQD